MSETILCFHGDYDGVASAAMIIKKYAISNYKTIICEPFTVNRAAAALEAEPVRERSMFILDIAPNNRNVKMTKKSIDRFSAIARSVVLYDHHAGWEGMEFNANVEANIGAGYKSCAGFIYERLGLKSFSDPIIDSMARDADIIDTGGYDGISDETAVIYRAMKSELKDDVIKAASLNYILSSYSDQSLKKILSERAAGYDKIFLRSLELSKNFIELTPRICYLNVGMAECDLTAIIREFYKKYPYAVLEYASGGTNYVIIATILPNEDLPAKFGLKSGSRARITIVKKDLNEIVSRLEAR